MSFLNIVYNPLFWWPFTFLRPKHGEKFLIKNIFIFLFLYDLFTIIASALIFYFVYFQFNEKYTFDSYIYWSIVIFALVIVIIIMNLFYLFWAFLWNKEIK